MEGVGCIRLLLINVICILSFSIRTGKENTIYILTVSILWLCHVNYNLYIYSGCSRVVKGAGRKAKRMVLQCINGVGSNPVEGRTKI